MASDFVPVGDETEAELTAWAAISSLKDETPEGRSVIELAKKLERSYDSKLAEGGEFVEFKAETRMSGIDLLDGRSVRKGAVDSVKKWVQSKGGVIPANLDSNSDAIARMGGPRLLLR